MDWQITHGALPERSWLERHPAWLASLPQLLLVILLLVLTPIFGLAPIIFLPAYAIVALTWSAVWTAMAYRLDAKEADVSDVCWTMVGLAFVEFVLSFALLILLTIGP